MKKSILFSIVFIITSTFAIGSYFVFSKIKLQDQNNFQYIKTIQTKIIGKSIIRHPDLLLIENIGQTNQSVEPFVSNIKPQSFDTFLVFIHYENIVYSINIGLDEYQKINLDQNINVDLFQTPIFKYRFFTENPETPVFKQKDKGYIFIPFQKM